MKYAWIVLGVLVAAAYYALCAGLIVRIVEWIMEKRK